MSTNNLATQLISYGMSIRRCLELSVDLIAQLGGL